MKLYTPSGGPASFTFLSPIYVSTQNGIQQAPPCRRLASKNAVKDVLKSGKLKKGIKPGTISEMRVLWEKYPARHFSGLSAKDQAGNGGIFLLSEDSAATGFLM